MRVYDTLSAQKQEFVPQGDVIKMYVCGVTPYDEAHLGHAMSYIIFDNIRRYLLSRGYKVKYIQNVTDFTALFPGHAVKEGLSNLQILQTFFGVPLMMLAAVLSDRFRQRKPALQGLD